MICKVDPEGEVPICEQTCERVKFAVANGSLITGQVTVFPLTVAWIPDSRTDGFFHQAEVILISNRPSLEKHGSINSPLAFGEGCHDIAAIDVIDSMDGRVMALAITSVPASSGER